jgi:anoctamin-10
MFDEVRRVVSETLLPYVMQNRMKMQKKLKAKILSSESADEKKVDKNSAKYIEEKEMEEIEKEEYETFDDYLEMIVTFGYITLFAAAFPLASTIAVVFIYFESRSDIFKLEKIMKRPEVIKTNSIGSWVHVLELMAFLSVFTNIVLFAYASDQIDYLIPALQYYKNSSTTSVLTMFSIEHALIAFMILLRALFDKDPKWVKIFFARQSHKKQQKKYAKVTTLRLGNALMKKSTIGNLGKPASSLGLKSEIST